MQSRDKAAFIEMLEVNKGIVFKVCNTYCRDKEDQKDLAQDIIVQLWRSFPKYAATRKISTWMYSIALNVAISYVRKTTTRRKHTPVIDTVFVDIAHDYQETNSEDLQLLKQFINELDELNKALIILYLDGNSHEEIAAILNISRSNVGTKINRIKKTLKKRFESVEK
jgi:RNA polymerase sigma-70 factor (ECF subfamily)